MPACGAVVAESALVVLRSGAADGVEGVGLSGRDEVEEEENEDDTGLWRKEANTARILTAHSPAGRNQ